MGTASPCDLHDFMNSPSARPSLVPYNIGRWALPNTLTEQLSHSVQLRLVRTAVSSLMRIAIDPQERMPS